MIKSALSLFGISVCPDVYLYLNSARSPVIFHFIQVFLPQVNWPLSNTAFRKVRKKEGCLCVLGLEGHKRKKERTKETGWEAGFEHCVVKAFGSGTSICHLPSRFYLNERNKKLNLARTRQLNRALGVLMKGRCLFIVAGECEKVLIHLCNLKATVNMLEPPYCSPRMI